MDGYDIYDSGEDKYVDVIKKVNRITNEDDVLDLSDTTNMKVWIAILERQVSEMDQDLVSDFFMNSCTSGEHILPGVADDSYEVEEFPMKALPSENVANFPQENPAYLATKRYVRNDKYQLASIVKLLKLGNTSLPTTMSAYGSV